MASGKHAAPKQPRKERRDRPGRPRALPWIVAAACAVLVLGAYGAGAAYFSTHFLPGTVIGGEDVSLMDAQAAHDALRGCAEDYRLSVSSEGFDLAIVGSDIDLAVDVDAVQPSDTGNPLLWPARILGGSKPAQIPVRFDEERLSALVEDAANGRNAALAPKGDDPVCYFDAEQRFVPASYLAARQIDAAATTEVAKEAVLALEPAATAVERGGNGPVEDVDPAVEAACEAANGLLGCDLSLTMGGTEAAHIDADLVASWIVFEGDAPSLDESAARTWAQRTASDLTTLGKPRTYTRADGKEVSVEAGEKSAYGWVVDGDALADLVVDAVSEKRTGDAQVPCTQSGTGYQGSGQDWGAYVDVDLTEQRARYYNADGELAWESGIVSGNPTQGNDTPCGVYQLNAKKRDIVLRGATDPETGKPSYESPVSYWMAFIGNLYGLHDASWQAKENFGDPEAYLSSGSHGCVNLPPDKAKELFDLVQVGDVVVVHA